MSIEDLLHIYPVQRIKPRDGMAVTADVWDQAHEYHQQHQRFQTLLYHGWGIVTGLEVMASDPPDTSVYILPGIAVDPTGQTIVLPQPVAYDIGDEMEGLLYLLLSYGEGAPRSANGDQEDAPTYVQAEFSIAARTALPDAPFVELARVKRQDRTDPFLDAQNPDQPDANEIDLRFRREIRVPREVSIGVCYLGDVDEKKHGRGAGYLADALSRSSRYQVTVHDDVLLAPGIETNTLIYLVGGGDFELSSSQMNGLSNYVARGRGTLLLESFDAAAEATFTNILAAMDMEPIPLPSDHRLLKDPYLFAAPPPGFEPGSMPEVSVNDGVILSNGNYGLLWQGETRDALPSREQIRCAVEWGTNIVAYALDRRRRL